MVSLFVVLFFFAGVTCVDSFALMLFHSYINIPSPSHILHHIFGYINFLEKSIGSNLTLIKAKFTLGEGHAEVVRFLHQRGASLTRLDRKDHPYSDHLCNLMNFLRNDKTIMHLAALNNRAEVILLLLRAKGGEDLVNMNDQVKMDCEEVLGKRSKKMYGIIWELGGGLPNSQNSKPKKKWS